LIILSDHRITWQHYRSIFGHIQAIDLYINILHLHNNSLRFQSNNSEIIMKCLIYVYAVKCPEGGQNWSSTLPCNWI